MTLLTVALWIVAALLLIGTLTGIARKASPSERVAQAVIGGFVIAVVIAAALQIGGM